MMKTLSCPRRHHGQIIWLTATSQKLARHTILPRTQSPPSPQSVSLVQCLIYSHPVPRITATVLSPPSHLRGASKTATQTIKMMSHCPVNPLLDKTPVTKPAAFSYHHMILFRLHTIPVSSLRAEVWMWPRHEDTVRSARQHTSSLWRNPTLYPWPP